MLIANVSNLDHHIGFVAGKTGKDKLVIPKESVNISFISPLAVHVCSQLFVHIYLYLYLAISFNSFIILQTQQNSPNRQIASET